MKKTAYTIIIAIAAVTIALSACNNSAPQQSAKPAVAVNPLDTLKTYLAVMKMEVAANTYAMSHAYDSAIGQYDKCIAFLDTSMSKAKDKGVTFYGNAMAEINVSKAALYDSLHDADNWLKCNNEILKWAKATHNYLQEINTDIKTSEKLRELAALAEDTAKRGALGREAITYVLSGVHVIDSLRTNDMEDLRYQSYYLASMIYSTLGDKKDAADYNNKYKKVYYSIYKKMPEGK